MDKQRNLFTKLFCSPLFLGGALSIGFYGSLHCGFIDHPLMMRYFTGHEVEYITTVMFFAGFASLILKYLEVRRQRGILQYSPVLEERAAHKVNISQAEHYLENIRQYEEKKGCSFLTQRLKTALQYVQRSGSAEDLDSELRYLADEDSDQADAGYGLVRLILWAVPMLGFLGTVIGITIALGNLDLNAINESSKMLSAGLMVAFDTTALAIALDVTLFFIQFLVYREEGTLLRDVEKSADNELRGRFDVSLAPEGGEQVAAVRQMLETVLSTLEQFSLRQAKHWEQSMLAAQQHFNSIAEQKANVWVQSVSAALNDGLKHHAKALAQAESQMMDKTRDITNKFSDILRANTAGMISLKEESVKQLKEIQNVLGTSGQLARLEERLSGNLAALSQAGNFEETVNSLAATIHLLNGKYRLDGRNDKFSGKKDYAA